MRKTLLSTFFVLLSVYCMIFGVYAMGETRLGLQAQLDYQPIEYNITLNYGDGSENGQVSATYGEAVEIANPIREGYTFTGWSANVLIEVAKCGASADSLTVWDGTITKNTYFKNLADTANASVILTANWVESNSVQNGSQNENIASTYSINYKDQTGLNFSGTYDTQYPQTHTYGVDTTLVSPTKEGYTFEGWFLSEDCSGEPVTSLSGLDYSQDITLYAKWVSVLPTLTINFIRLDATHEINLSLSVLMGTDTLSKKSISIGESATLTKESGAVLILIVPSDTSYNYFITFEEMTAYDADIAQNSIRYNYYTEGSQTINIYVTEIYTISFDANGGSGTAVESINKVFGETASLPTNKFVKAGFTANGWNTKADGSGDNYISTCSANDNITLYANFKAS